MTRVNVRQGYMVLMTATVILNALLQLQIGTDRLSRLRGVLVLMPGLTLAIIVVSLVLIARAKSSDPEFEPALHAVLAVLLPPVIAVAMAFAAAALFPATGSTC